uniref:Cytochrome c oxidase subunit 2 n=1 Tax=Halocynthia roretzi TaxID=7729 RepID=Q9T9H4_HALRO|nr:cytochrome c oxidase subunit II [Halocynthia roretzi]BAA88256.1 Cytochrome oxidase subunit II [Halocynthia roretzi]
MYNSLGLQDCFNYIGMEVYLFHDYSMLIVLFILIGVMLSVLVILGSGGYMVKGYRSSEFLELTWTVVPGFLLMSLGVPSLFLMYYMEGAVKYDLTVKAVGHQWYWSYEIGDYGEGIEFDSYMVGLDDLVVEIHRLLNVDNSLVLPYLTKIRVLVGSGDVLHAWALPSGGLKADACPGRLNVLSLGVCRPGSMYGQCSEICGVNHSFMPIHVEWVSWEDFLMSHAA